MTESTADRMTKESGRQHMVKALGKSEPPGPLFADGWEVAAE